MNNKLSVIGATITILFVIGSSYFLFNPIRTVSLQEQQGQYFRLFSANDSSIQDSIVRSFSADIVERAGSEQELLLFKHEVFLTFYLMNKTPTKATAWQLASASYETQVDSSVTLTTKGKGFVSNAFDNNLPVSLSSDKKMEPFLIPDKAAFFADPTSVPPPISLATFEFQFNSKPGAPSTTSVYFPLQYYWGGNEKDLIGNIDFDIERSKTGVTIINSLFNSSAGTSMRYHDSNVKGNIAPGAVN